MSDSNKLKAGWAACKFDMDGDLCISVVASVLGPLALCTFMSTLY
jgi:hypothetical protein